MSERCTQITCRVNMDMPTLTNVLGQLRQHQVNLRKIELMQGITNTSVCYFHVEMDPLDDSRAHDELMNHIQTQLGKIAV